MQALTAIISLVVLAYTFLYANDAVGLILFVLAAISAFHAFGGGKGGQRRL